MGRCFPDQRFKCVRIYRIDFLASFHLLAYEPGCDIAELVTILTACHPIKPVMPCNDDVLGAVEFSYHTSAKNPHAGVDVIGLGHVDVTAVLPHCSPTMDLSA